MGAYWYAPDNQLSNMRTSSFFVLFLGALFWANCHAGRKTQAPTPTGIPVVHATAETPPVPAPNGKDAADDPAIWVNAKNPSQSLVIGTVKHYGLEVYDLQGNLRKSYPIGNPNNVDLRYGFPLNNGKKTDFLAFSDRATNEIAIFHIQAEDGLLIPSSAPRIQSKLAEVYGICLYHSALSGLFYVFVNGKDGSMEQYLLEAAGKDGIGGKLVRTFKVQSQPEGLVADDQMGIVYLGEEDKGIWKLAAEPNAPTSFSFLKESNPAPGRPIQFDIEGLAIFSTGTNKGYLIASSQGNNTYAVFDRAGDNPYLGSFTIEDNASKGLDGVGDTDGIEVCNQNLGGEFKEGLFVAQDGYNKDAAGKPIAQNFKLVPWSQIQKLLKK
jgi:3-phytase